MLVIEGPDGVGKTTFAMKCLNAAYKSLMPTLKRMPQYCHFGKMPDWWQYYTDYVPFAAAPYLIADRFILSELVYGSALRSGPKISSFCWDRLHALMTVSGSLTVVLSIETELLEERLSNKQDENTTGVQYDLQQILKVNDGYQSYINACVTARSVSYLGERYRPYIDVMLDMTRESPFPTDEMVDVVVKKWYENLLQLSLYEKRND